MITLAAPSACTGCMACAQVCPVQCITTTKDKQGNIFPQINHKLCISCGRCQCSCPTLTLLPGVVPKAAYAVWSLDDADRRSSASGGAASVFYQTALAMGYWICGTEYTDKFHVVHTVTRDPQKIARYKQSKYVFSETDGSYPEIQALLNQGEKVLFISLPCKVAGLLRFLGKPYDNLITVDIVCHGTPSHDRLYQHILDVLKGRHADRLKFRQDNTFCFDLQCNTKSVYHKIGQQDTYLAAFLAGLDYRDSCYQCTYARQERIADLTICDFWGLGQEIPFDHPYTGSISAVLINSDAGRCFFTSSQDLLFWEERPVWEALKGNAQLNYPTHLHPKREQFDAECELHGFEQAVRTCLHEEIAAHKKELSRQQLRQALRKTAGMFIKRYRG